VPRYLYNDVTKMAYQTSQDSWVEIYTTAQDGRSSDL